MDQHFSNIINTFKRLDESTKKNSHGHSKKQQAAIAIAKQGMAEGGMHDAEHNPRGAKFGGYWKGTDKNPPRPGQGVGSSESIQEEIAREWKAYVQEAGANNPQQGGQQLNPQQQQARERTLTTSVQKISQATGKKPVGGVPIAVKGADELLKNPNADPATGKGMSPQAKKFTATVTDELGPALLDPQAAQQIATAVKQATQKQKMLPQESNNVFK